MLGSLLLLVGVTAPAGAMERGGGLRNGSKPGLGIQLGGITEGFWSRLIRLAGGSHVTIDPDGQPFPGEGTDNRGTIDPNGQPAAGTSLDNHITIDPNG